MYPVADRTIPPYFVFQLSYVPEKKNVQGLQESLQLLNVGFFAVQKLLRQQYDALIGRIKAVEIFVSLNNASGVTLYHHSGGFGAGVTECELHLGHHIRHGLNSRIQLLYGNSPDSCQLQSLPLNGIVFPKLRAQFVL